MKITLDAIDGKQFTLRLPRAGDAREHVVALHSTRRLRGVYEHAAQAIHLDPVEADEIVGEVTWMLASGVLRVAGPARMGGTSLDVDLALDAGASSGEVRCASFAAPIAAITLDDLDVRGGFELGAVHALHDPAADAWTLRAATLDAQACVLAHPSLRVEVERISASAVEAVRGAGAMCLWVAELRAQGLTLALGPTSVRVASATIKGLRVSRAAGVLVLDCADVALCGVDVDAGGRGGRAGELHIRSLHHGPDGTSFDQLDGDEVAFAFDPLGVREGDPLANAAVGSADRSRPVGVDLSVLDVLDGRIEADTRVEIRLPVIQRRTAKHTARLAITAGSINFKELEHGLSLLEDAILDFEVEDDALVLELDALLAKKTLLSWPLDRDGVERARRGEIRLRALLQPTLSLSANEDDEGDCAREPLVALERVEVGGLLVEAALPRGTTMAVGPGALRLGAADAPTLGLLRLRGALVYDPTHQPDPTELHVELTNLDLGADGITLGDRCLDVGRLTLGRVTDGVVTLSGLRPAAARATLHELSIRSLRLRPSTVEAAPTDQ